MWMIVFYHLHIYVLMPEYGLSKAIQIPLHIAVLLFVLISGFFGIKASVKGLSKLISQVLTYSIVAIVVVFLYGLLYKQSTNLAIIDFIDGVLCVSSGNLWFVRTYIYLFLLAPFFNKILYGQSLRQRLALIGILILLSIYMGGFRGDPSMSSGKNLINFLLLYVIGWSIHEYNLLKDISSYLWFTIYFVFFIILVSLYILFENTFISSLIWGVSFKYNSPLLILGSIILFMGFNRLKISSRVINYVASSTFAVYLIHEGLIGKKIIYPSLFILKTSIPHTQLYVFILLISLLIFVSCILIDKLLKPVYGLISVKIERTIRFSAIAAEKILNKKNG